MSKILLTGATGLIGTQVAQKLSESGHTLFVITRDAHTAQSKLAFPAHFIEGHLEQESLRNSELSEVDAVIHMMGESIDGHWTKGRRQRIYDSRAKASQNLVDTLIGNHRIKKIISFSAVGYYGNRGDELLSENSTAGEGFLSQVCNDWEKPWQLASAKKIFPSAEISLLRAGMVLAKNGGALVKLKNIFEKRMGSVLGSGQQWISWIHCDDLTNLVCWMLDSKNISGTFNAVSPEPVQNALFSKTLAEILGRGMLPRIPEIVLRLVVGEMSTIVLDSQKVSCQKLLDAGFQFQHPNFKEAVENLLV